MASLQLRALLIDLSGTIHVSDTPTPGAGEAIRRLRDAGIALRWLSNTSKESRKSLLEKMKRMELDVREEELFTSLSAVSRLVSARKLNPLYLLSTSALEDFPPSSPPYDSVVVGLAPDRLTYPVLNEAFRLLAGESGIKDVPLIATHKALYVRSSDGALSLGPGPFITALEEAASVQAEVVGKPSPAFFSLAISSLSSLAIPTSLIGIIGDDRRQDVGAVPGSLGLIRFLVRTGKYRAGDEDAMEEEGGRPDWVGASFTEAVERILSEA